MRRTAMLTVAIALVATPALAQPARGGGFAVRTLSARPDMVSGGDVLIEITAPSSTGAEVTNAVNGHAAKAELEPGAAANTLIARLQDLQPGSNLIEVGMKGRRPAVRLTVVNHPIAGPVMSGPHQTPFSCETQAFGPWRTARCRLLDREACRLVAANGTSGNQVLHTYAPGIFMDRVQPANLDDMEHWLAAIAKDTAPARTPLEKTIRNRPPTVTDACYTRDGETMTDMRRCTQMFPAYSNPRLIAGQPIGATLLKCELKPVDAKDYTATLTGAQLAAVKTAFPAGVCDYKKKGVAVRAPDSWLSYGAGIK